MLFDLKPKVRFLYYKTKSKCVQCVVVILIFVLLVTTHEKYFGKNVTFFRFGKGEANMKTPVSLPRSNSRTNEYTLSSTKSLKLPRAVDRVKILCYILLSRSKVKTARVIKETWGSHCDKLIFFGGYTYPELPVTPLNVTEGYENLWGKAKAAINYLASDPSSKNFDYFLKADDDTFVIVENLRKFVVKEKDQMKKPVWFGFKLKHRRMSQGYMSGGAGYVFNYSALERLGSILKYAKKKNVKYLKRSGIGDCNIDGEYGVEDLELGKCFLHAKVESVNTRDEHGRERFLPLSYDVFLNGAISSFHWIWSQAWNPVKTGKNCCSKNLISMHEVSPSQMKTIYYLLYKIYPLKNL